MLKVMLAILVMLTVPLGAGAKNSTQARAQSTSTLYGVPDCGQWVNDQNPQYKAWLLGYLSGHNTMFNSLSVKNNSMYDPLSELSSADQAFVWMDNWCQKNPLKNVRRGADILFLELSMQKGHISN